MVFDAAMRRAGEQWWVEGGRAADAVVRSTTREDARARVYGALAELDGGGWRVRGDIAAVHGRVCTGSGPVSRTVLGGRVDGGA
jgi:phosphoribosylamine-glycine ligase